MRTAESTQNNNSRRGSAGIILVIILVAAAAVYAFQAWRKSHTPDPDTSQDLMPWQEWSIREESKKPVPPISDKQPKITTSLRYDANVELTATKEPRGEVDFIITQDGEVFGAWSGTYYNQQKDNFDVQNGKFKGKVYPARIYQDEKGQDQSKLYFLAKGKFMIHHIVAKDNSYKIYSGELYVSGWLNTDFSIAGDITITSDRKYSEIFHWQVSRPAGN
jgi:hypothetical protein